MTEFISQHNGLLWQALAGLAAALVSAPLAIWLARRLHLMDVPGRSAHKLHARPTPLAGGLVLGLSLLLLLPFQFMWHKPISVLLLSGLVVFIFGLWDDAKGLSASKKFIGQFLAAGLLIASDYSVHFIGNMAFRGSESPVVPILDWVITILWFVGITNAFNLIDSMDGLAVGVAGNGFAWFALMASASQAGVLAGFSALLFGICVGLFLFNRRPARLFLGDAGALSLGFILAAAAMIFAPLESVPQSASWFVPVIVLGYPIFDTTLVVVSRLRRRRSVFKADRTHTYHRLLTLGFKPGQAVVLIHSVSFLLGFLGYLSISLPPTASIILFGSLLAVAAALIVYLERVPVLCESETASTRAGRPSAGAAYEVPACDLSAPGADLEFDFIRACLAHRLYPNRPFPVSPDGLNWDRLYALLLRHRLAAHFYLLGKSQDGAAWPDEFHQRLRIAQFGLLVYGDQSYKRVQSVLSALAERDVPVMVLKGWALIQSIYAGDYSQRFCSDLDILIRPSDMDAAEQALESIGCRGAIENWPGFRRNYLKVRPYTFPTQMPILGIDFSIGLHWNLLHAPFDSHLIDVERLFGRAGRITVADRPVLELSVEDHIVYTCSHVALHHYTEQMLFYFYELAAVIHRAGPSLDWSAVIRRAVEWQKVMPLRSVLAYTEALWPGLAPGRVLAELAEIQPALHERFVNQWLKVTKGRPPFDHFLGWLTYFDASQRAFIIFQDIFPSREYMQKRYGEAPGGFWPLLYLRRFIRGAAALIR